MGEVIHNVVTMLPRTFNRFQWGKLAGWGIAIYAVMYFIWSMFVLHGFAAGILPRIVLLVALVVVAGIAGRSLRLGKWEDILPYTFGWTLIAIVFDALTVVPAAGWGIYTDWNIWVGYALLLFVPLLAPLTSRRPEPMDIV